MLIVVIYQVRLSPVCRGRKALLVIGRKATLSTVWKRAE
jgi:hypothetical protein